MVLVLITVTIVLLIKFASAKMGIAVLKEWMRENDFPYPSSEDIDRIARHIIRKLFGKGE